MSYRSIFDPVHDLADDYGGLEEALILLRYLKLDLLFIDDMGLKSLTPTAAY